jgi:hypothetical protein
MSNSLKPTLYFHHCKIIKCGSVRLPVYVSTLHPEHHFRLISLISSATGIF